MQLSVLVLLSGMMIETMAGKSAALHGLCHDATPFTFSEDNPAVDYFGKLLLKGLYILSRCPDRNVWALQLKLLTTYIKN